MTALDAQFAHLSTMQRNKIFKALQLAGRNASRDDRWFLLISSIKADKEVRRQARKYGVSVAVIESVYHHVLRLRGDI